MKGIGEVMAPRYSMSKRDSRQGWRPVPQVPKEKMFRIVNMTIRQYAEPLTGIVSANGGGNGDGRSAALGGEGREVRGVVVLVLELSHSHRVAGDSYLRVGEVVCLSKDGRVGISTACSACKSKLKVLR